MLTFRPAALRSCLVALFVFFGLSKAHANITIIHAGKTTVTVQHNGPPTPTPPADFVITNQSGNQITLAWTAAIALPGRTIARYDVFLNGNKVASTTDSNISLTSDPDGPLLQFFTVQAIDNRGTISPLSAEILVSRANEPLNARIQAKYANTGQNSKDGVTGPTGKSFTAVNYSHEKLADEFTTEGNKIGHRENRLTIAESYNPVVGGWTSVVTGTSDVTRTESYYSLPAVVQHSDWQLLENRAVLVGSSTGSMTLPSVAIPNLPGGVSTATGTTAVVSDSTVLLYNLEGGGYFNVPHGTLTRNETYTLSYANEFTDAMLVTKMLRDYVIAKAGASAVPWPDFDLDVSAFAKNGSLLAASPVNFWDGRPFYYAELVGRRNSQNPVQGSLSTVSGQGSTYRLHTARSGPARFRWIEVFSPYFYGPQGQVTTGPDQSVLREEAVIGGPTGAISREYVVDPPASFGGTSVITLRDGVSVRTPSMSPSPGAPRLYLKNAIFSGEAAQIDFTGVDLGRTTTAIVRATGDAASVRIVAVELGIVADQGMAAALAQGVVIAPGTDLIAESHQILAGGWQLVAVGLTFGTANVTLEITNSGVTYGLGTAITVYPPVGLAVDANRDGAITFDAADATSVSAPYRFWLNDDDDSGDMGGDDITKSSSTDAADTGLSDDGSVDGTRDLIDFFPVYLDIKQLLAVLPPSASIKYKLKQADSALNFVYTNLTRDRSFAYHKELLTTGFSDQFDQKPGVAATHRVTAAGVELSTAFLTGVKDNDWGVVLIEGRMPTTVPLVLAVEKDGATIAEVKLELRLSRVEDMFRHVDLTGAAKNYNGSASTLPEAIATTRTGDPGEPWPDSLTNGKYFVFVHGYNVDGQKARGWNCEVFKRMHALGSKARFVGVTWHGTTGLDYHKAVYQAFQTGDALKTALTFTGSADVTIAAHSLGNMVVSHAIQSGGYSPSRYYLINAAVPIEAYDLGNVDAAQRTAMFEDDWKSRDARFYASNWHQLFSATPTDRRNELSWKNRFRDVPAKAFNFYSPGEDVVENATTDTAAVGATILNQGFNFSKGAWTAQELVKGVNWTTSLAAAFMERGQGGWDSDLAYLFTSHASITSEQLKTRPFFDEFKEDDLINVDPAIASAKAGEAKVQYDLLARGLPALSYAAAANRLSALDLVPPSRNFDMEAEGRTQNQWPTEGHSGGNAGKWLHSDFKNAALPYVYQMYEAMIAKGSLK